MEKYCKYCGLPLNDGVCSCQEALNELSKTSKENTEGSSNTVFDNADASNDKGKKHVTSNNKNQKSDVGSDKTKHSTLSEKPIGCMENDSYSIPCEDDNDIESSVLDTPLTSSSGTAPSHYRKETALSKKYDSAFRQSFSSSRQTVIELATDPIETMAEEKTLSISTGIMLLVSQSIAIMLLVISLFSRLDRNTLASSGIALIRQIISYSLLSVLLSAGLLFFAIFLISKLFKGEVKPLNLFGTIAKASIPYSAFFISAAVITFILPVITGPISISLIFLLLFVVAIYSLYLVELGTRLQIPDNCLRILTLSLSYGLSFILLYWLLGRFVADEINILLGALNLWPH